MTHIKILLLLFGFGLYYSVSAHVDAGTIDPAISDTKYVEYGEDFHCVTRICGTYKDDSTFCASAVLIDDHHILTAAHVVKDCKTCYITLQDKKYTIVAVVINKTFDTEFGCGDIAIGYCEEAFNLNFYPALYENDNEVGRVCSISGYGLTGTFITGAVKSDNKKRAGSNTIDSIYRDMLVCSPSNRRSKEFTELEFFIASGDSGGGLFIDGKLAGINSCIMVSNRSPRSSYGEESGHTRISKFIGWINENKTKVDRPSKR